MPTGVLDLSGIAIISLVNVVIVTQLGNAEMPDVTYTLAAAALSIGLGAAMGAVNGLLVGYMQLQSIVVTLGVMFICQGAALLVLQYPGGEVLYDFTVVFVGDAIPDLLPAPVVILGIAMLVWLYIRRTRFGTALYAVGSDPSAAAANRALRPGRFDQRRSMFLMT